jgi:hypothetical protein
MAEHDNEQLTRRFYEEFWTRGNVDAADDLIAEDLVHDQFPEGWPAGREEWIYCEEALGVFAQLGALPADLSGVAGPLHAG